MNEEIKVENLSDGFLTLGTNILVRELCDDFMCGGVVTKYDPDSPYMFCKIVNICEEAIDAMNILDSELDYILVIKRYAKEEFIDQTYFIDAKDVRAIIPPNVYERMKGEGLEWMMKERN